MEFFKAKGGRVFVNHHGAPFFPFPRPSKTICVDPSNWIYNDDIDVETDNDEP